MRAGGKHNDLENVGYTARHRLLPWNAGPNCQLWRLLQGQDAIKYAWELLTGGENWFALPKENCGYVYESR